MADLTDEQKVRLLHNYANNTFSQMLEMRIQTVTKECFDVCVKNPTYSSRTQERECVLRCNDRAYEGLKLINTVLDKLQTPKGESFE